MVSQLVAQLPFCSHLRVSWLKTGSSSSGSLSFPSSSTIFGSAGHANGKCPRAMDRTHSRQALILPG